MQPCLLLWQMSSHQYSFSWSTFCTSRGILRLARLCRTADTVRACKPRPGLLPASMAKVHVQSTDRSPERVHMIVGQETRVAGVQGCFWCQCDACRHRFSASFPLETALLCTLILSSKPSYAGPASSTAAAATAKAAGMCWRAESSRASRAQEEA